MTDRPTACRRTCLTEIYGEEDWSATIRKVEDEPEDAAASGAETGAPLPDPERLAGIT